MNLDWNKMEGLIPAVVQHAESGQVLMLGYMNEEALEVTQKTQKVTFYSRSKQKLWTKGETSNNFLNLVSIKSDCDSDALLVEALPEGPTCHTGELPQGPVHEVAVVIQISRHHNQQEIVVAGGVVARKYPRRTVDGVPEFGHSGWVVPGTTQLDKSHDAQPQFPAVEVGLVTLDHTAFLKPFQPPPAGRLTQGKPFCQPCVRHATVTLQQIEHGNLSSVQFLH